MRRLAWLALLASGCSQVLGVPEVQRGPCDPAAPFVTLAPVPGLDSPFGTQSAQLSRDELTVVLSRTTVAGTPDAPVARHGDLYLAHRDHRASAFQDIIPLDELNTGADERSASLSDDLLTLYFERRDGAQPAQIFAARRASPDGAFGTPMPLVLQSPASDVAPFATASALYFASRQPDGSARLFTATGRGTVFAAARELVSLETLPAPAAYEHPVVSSDGLTIYFSAPPDSASPRDIWRASRADLAQPFGPARAVPELNTRSAEQPSWLSDDRCRMYFLTNRDGRGSELWLASRAP